MLAIVLDQVALGPDLAHKVRRLRQLLFVAVVATAVALGLRHDARESARRTARLEMEQILTAARHFRQDFGRCPHDLGELAHPPAGGVPYLARDLQDPWGRPYDFRCPGRWNEDAVDIASRGPDGRWMGGDDITTDL